MNKNKREDFEVFVFSDTGAPTFVNMVLTYQGKAYVFSFIFLTREKKDQFMLNYPVDLFPPDNSIEIQICSMPVEIEKEDCDSIHVVTNLEWSPLEKYVCHYPGANYDEALKIAKFWAKYNVRKLMTGSDSVKEEDVHKFKLDKDIEVIIIR